MKLDETIESYREVIKSIEGFVAQEESRGNKTPASNEALGDYESTLSLLLELKQRRKQDLTLGVIEYLQRAGDLIDCKDCIFKPPEGDDCMELFCGQSEDWLNDQEQRLKGGSK